MDDKVIIPQHQWTHDGDRVLLVKCINADGTSHDGFVWPQSGPVKPLRCSRAADCESGGLFGWPWGVNLGGGKEPDYTGIWIVFAAKPSQVVDLKDKAKVCADTPDDVECEVLYYGDALGALIYTLPGRVAWTQHSASGSASSTGERGSASSTGESGSASSTGWSGSASSTGWSGSASSTGARGSASSTGWSGSASSTGARGSASSTGERGVACLSGEYGTIEVGSLAIGAVMAQEWTWKVHTGAVVACRWKDRDKWYHRLLVADELGLADGAVVRVISGKLETEKQR